jgi:hypothetical protein
MSQEGLGQTALYRDHVAGRFCGAVAAQPADGLGALLGRYGALGKLVLRVEFRHLAGQLVGGLVTLRGHLALLQRGDDALTRFLPTTLYGVKPTSQMTR